MELWNQLFDAEFLARGFDPKELQRASPVIAPGKAGAVPIESVLKIRREILKTAADVERRIVIEKLTRPHAN